MSAENPLLCLTTAPDRTAAELHPSEVPEVIALDVSGGLPAYLQWIADETAGSAPA